jgi:hypothetical protein
MEIEGLLFVKDALQAFAIVAMAIGVLIGLSDIIDVQENAGEGRLRKGLKAVLVAIKDASWTKIPSMATRSVTRGAFGYVSYWFGLSKDNYLPVGLFLLLIFVAVPMSILINLIQGGAPWLFDFLLSIAIAFVILIFLGENRRIRYLNSFLSVYLFVALFIALPGYIFTVVNGRMLLMPTGHAAIGSILVAPILYLFCYALLMAVNRTNHFIALFIASIPINYILTFAAFTAGHLAAAAHPSEQNWSLLLASIFFSSLSITISVLLFRTQKVLPSLTSSFVAGVLCSYIMLYVDLVYDGDVAAGTGAFNVLLGQVPSGDAYALNPQFWVMHLPLVPCLLYLCFIAFGWTAKLLVEIELKIAAGHICISRPFVMAGVFLIGSGGILIIATRFI